MGNYRTAEWLQGSRSVEIAGELHDVGHVMWLKAPEEIRCCK